MPALLIILLLLLSPSTVFAAPDLFSFAESLAAENDHYRAITEYKRFLHYQPQDSRAPRAQLAIARSLIAGQRWRQSDAALEKVWQNYPDSPEAVQARRLYADSAFDRKDYAVARQRYRRLKQLPGQTTQQVDYRIGLSYLEENRLQDAQQSFSSMSGTEAPELLEELENYRRLPRKSPQLAGTLSALLPGAGQLYTGRLKQAGVAFALNAAFIYGAIEAWNNENYTVSGILSLFEVGWYGGNIYNAMNNAHKYNREREEAFKQRLRNRGGLSLGIHRQMPWLQARFNF
ncbi:MAG: tetratricopeptide repeat protein [Deltaproteobacteria bacterium]|nr:tetratricopeptide repeat protein [Deltaproteobacteria bacterium]